MKTKLYLGIYFLFFSKVFFGQILTTSPFSYYGIGERSVESDAILQGLAYSSASFADSGVINYTNPATYSYFGSGYTLFSTGIHGRFSQFTENNESTFKAFSNLNHLVIGLKLSPILSGSFGLRPYSFRGYKFSNKMFTGSDSLLYDYRGSGTSQIAFGGLGIKVLNLKKTKLSIGGNVGYLFGTLSNDRLSRMISGNSLAGGIEKRKLSLSSLYYDFGIHFKQSLTKQTHLELGASYEPTQNLTGNFSNGLFYSNNVFNEKIFDTITFNQVSGSIAMPSNLNLGLCYTLEFKNLIKNNRKLNSQIKFLINYSIRDYTSYKENFDSLSNGGSFSKNERYSFGIQYIPEKNYFENNALTKFYQRIYYRAGFFNESTTFNTVNNKIENFGITFGIGIPIFAQQSLSSVNLAVNLGRIQKNTSNSLSENYAAVNFGIILSPSVFDKWFRKRKLD